MQKSRLDLLIIFLNPLFISGIATGVCGLTEERNVMTSQIAIYNRLGVAVASDTVATITSVRGTKTINDSEKIRALGGEHLVVVLINGSADINGMHPRLLVSEWARTLLTPLSTLEEYVEGFTSWFTQHQSLITKDLETIPIRFCLWDHYREIRRRTLNDAKDLESAEEIRDNFLNKIQAGTAWLEGLSLYEGATDESDGALLTEYEVDLDAIVDEVFNGFPNLDEVREHLKAAAPLVLSRSQEMSSDTELAFIGFGANDRFAGQLCVRIRGRYGSSLRFTADERYGSEPGETSSGICTFAQDSAMTGFLWGAEEAVLRETFNSARNLIYEQYPDEETGTSKADEFVEKMRIATLSFQQQSFLQPMLNAIAFLNLKDMAKLAEALVGIQAMRASASPQPASVGGFIESLIIDRSNGIKWVNRMP